MNDQRSVRLYQWSAVGFAAMLVTWNLVVLPATRLDLRFLLLALATLIVSSRVAVKIPRRDSNITFSDTFIFAVILLYGGEAAVLLAAAEGVSAGFRVSKQRKPVTILFNSAANALPTFFAVLAARLAFGPETNFINQKFGTFVAALSLMALVQYLANSSMIAVGLALKHRQPILNTWTRHCLWSSLSHFIGAGSAGILVGLIHSAGFYAIFGAVPVIWVVYVTYQKYLEDIKATARLAEIAETARAEAEYARAEAERERAELAERNVEEQRRHIAELQRIGRELAESREHFRRAAFHDTLTGLPNRALLTDHLGLSIERARRHSGHLFAVLFLDLDRFKYINDSLGHAAGDRLLIEVARRLERCLRGGDTVARLGGDEFALLLDGLETHSDAIRVAERAQEELTRPMDLNGHEVFTTASIGIALCDARYDDPAKVLRDADAAMYHAKENGKARYEMFDAAMHASAVARLQLENDLRRAMENREFEVHYQPIVTLQTGEVAGFEALLRWHHPQRGFVQPDEFIPLAEETGLIGEIGMWVINEACQRAQEWSLLGQPTSLMITVNVSGKQFVQADLIRRIQEILTTTGLDAGSLKLEITESAVMENAESAGAMLAQLRELGVQLSIDDFGTGYSSLSFLHRFPVNTLKVDRSFVSRMTEGEENVEIVKAILTLAANLGMAVVAEGVETEEQHSKLKDLKCKYGQGYLFSRPVDANEALALLQESLCTNAESAPAFLLRSSEATSAQRSGAA
jgi:diguanylate cyclase (GGDEF)-like protein